MRPRLILSPYYRCYSYAIKAEIRAIFQIHRLQAPVDPITNEALQWAALKGSILGTYYDDVIDTIDESEIRYLYLNWALEMILTASFRLTFMRFMFQLMNIYRH